jgi:hypothetical protein
MILKAAAPVSRLGAANRWKGAPRSLDRLAEPHPTTTKSKSNQVEVHA